MATRITNTDLDLLGTGQVTNLRKANAAGQALRYQDLLTESATVPSTPIPGEMWYDTDVLGRKTAVYTAANGWVNTARQHVIQFNLADYQDQADPVAAAIAAMATAFTTAPEPGAYNSYYWSPGTDASVRFELVVPPGIWGTLGTAYAITFPVRIVGATGDLPYGKSGGQQTSWLAGDFTFSGAAQCVFQGLYLEGQHTLNAAANFLFKDCYLVETSDYTERANDNPFITVTNAYALQLEGCYIYASGGARLRGVAEVAAGATAFSILDIRNCWFNHANAPAFRINRSAAWVWAENCNFEGRFGETALSLDRVNRLNVIGNDGNAGTFITSTVSGVTGGSWRIEGNKVAGAIALDFSGSSDANAGPRSLVLANNELDQTGKAFSLTTKGTGHAGAHVSITGNYLNCNAAGLSVEITGSAVATSTNVVLSDNRITNAVAGQAPVVVNNMGTVQIHHNTVTTTGAAQKAIDATNCSRVIVDHNITSGGTIDTTGTATALIESNV